MLEAKFSVDSLRNSFFNGFANVVAHLNHCYQLYILSLDLKNQFCCWETRTENIWDALRDLVRCNLKNVKNIHGEVLLRVFRIVQMVRNRAKHLIYLYR